VIIAICDDEEIYCKHTKQLCLNYLQNEDYKSEVLVFSSGEQLLAYSEDIDVVLLDIQMKGMDGIAVKERLRETRKETRIIFLTNHNELMQEAFGGQVYSFLTKPVDKEKLYKIMDIVVKEFLEEFIVELECYDKKYYIRGNTIEYIKAEDKYTRIITGEKEYVDNRTMSQWENILQKHNFYRTHKSYIINLKYIKNIHEVVVMENGAKISISRRNSKKFKDTYYNYIKLEAKHT
jgi:DNA-binding LytR/AlgR family response regulator